MASFTLLETELKQYKASDLAAAMLFFIRRALGVTPVPTFYPLSHPTFHSLSPHSLTHLFTHQNTHSRTHHIIHLLTPITLTHHLLTDMAIRNDGPDHHKFTYKL